MTDEPRPLYLYRQHACNLCDEAQLELDAADVRYIAFFVTAAPEPDQAIVWNPDGTEERVARVFFVGFPMLVDGDRAYVGLPAILQRIEMLESQGGDLSREHS